MDIKIVGGIVILIILLIFALVLFNFFGLWFQALMSKADVSLVQLLGMRFRKVPAKVIVEAKIMGIKAGVPLSTEELEAHYMAGGNVLRVVQALIAADKANIPLNFKRAAAIGGGAVVGEPEGDRDAPGIGHGHRRDPAQGHRARHRARQPGKAGGRRGRGDHPGARGRRHRVDHRFGQEP
jgi:hypothetical protein